MIYDSRNFANFFRFLAVLTVTECPSISTIRTYGRLEVIVICPWIGHLLFNTVDRPVREFIKYCISQSPRYLLFVLDAHFNIYR